MRRNILSHSGGARSARLTAFVAGNLLCLAATMAWAGALEDYVAKPDTNYTWKQLDQKKEGGLVATHLELISQQWRSNTWQHHLQVVRPEKVRNPGIAFLFITGDGDGQKNLGLLKILAERAGAIAAVVTKVPNQTLYGRLNDVALGAHP